MNAIKRNTNFENWICMYIDKKNQSSETLGEDNMKDKFVASMFDLTVIIGTKYEGEIC